ncbi:PucR family transcriptional regulator [Kutzneria sp. CA-103260]|uniref:PucR family transcriptional regulator n=1 Tax=Kutzneria sp. CA-103260 TaxID=2802641 RepID=UPI001BAE537D|nr:helix-turn-helix domain-containing protein [Kutzneria sp. CA-103260]QUQ63429.1 transcriptional regulator [Kutzneria sp. CA-103260]
MLADVDVPALVDRVLDGLVRRLPTYGSMPVEALTGDVRPMAERALRGFVESLPHGGVPAAELTAQARESAIARGEEGIPMEAILDAYLLGLQECVTQLRSELERAENAELIDFFGAVLTFQHVVHQAIASGFLEHRESTAGETQAARGALLAALVDGGDATDAAHRAGIRLREHYLVAALAIGPHPDESRPGVDHVMAARRKVSRVRLELASLGRDDVLTALSPTGGIALLPVADIPHARLAAAAGAEVTVAVETATPAAVPKAARLTREILEVAVKTRRGSGVYRLDDVLLEYQLTRPTEASARLAAALDPVDEDLLRTLDAYLDTGLRRNATAAVLGVHPNTVDNRLRRIGRLTGLDPTRPADLPMLRAAIAVRRMGS